MFVFRFFALLAAVFKYPKMKFSLLSIVAALSCVLVLSGTVSAQTNPTPHILSQQDYTFSHYAFNSAMTGYPPSMQGWVGNGVNLAQTAPTNLQATGDLAPCFNCGRGNSRFYRGRFSGVSLQNGHLGDGTAAPVAICLALNTEDCFGIQLSYLAVMDSLVSTLGLSSLQLQYRIGTSGNWVNVDNEILTSTNTADQTTDYRAYNTRVKSSQVLLPDTLNDRAVVQLRWLVFGQTIESKSDAFGVNMITVMPDSIRGKSNKYCRAAGIPESTGYIWSNISYGAAYQSAWIENVNISDTVINWVSSMAANGHGYSDFTNVKGKVQLGSVYTGTIVEESYYTDPLGAAIWIDWNQDGDFDDNGEFNYNAQAILGQNTTPPTYAIKVQFTVPLDALSGPTRCRVRLGYGTGGGSLEPCGPAVDGEVEDYTLIVENPLSPMPDCMNKATAYPTDNVSNVCTNLKRIQFTAVTGATGYEISLRNTNAGGYVFRDSLVTNPFVDLPSSLQPNTTYKWYVTTVNDNGRSYNCDSITFKTLANAAPVLTILPALDTIPICAGGSLPLTGSTGAGIAPFTYTWTGSGAAHLSSTTNSTPVFSHTVLGDYNLFLKVSDGNNCTDYDTTVIQVLARPKAGVLTAAMTNVCSQLPVDVYLKGDTGVISWEYRQGNGNWMSTSLLEIDDTTYLTHFIDDEYDYRAISDLNGCSDTGNVVHFDFHYAPAPPVILSSNGNKICENSTVILTTSNFPAGLNWSTGKFTDSLEVAQSGNYSAWFVDSLGCSSDTSDISLTSAEAPEKPIVNVMGNLPACDNNLPALMTISADQITWNDAAATQNSILYPMVGGDYVATAENANGCKTSSDTVHLTTIPAPAKPILSLLDPKPFYCYDEATTIVSDVSNDIFWNTGDINDTIVDATSDSVWVIHTSANGCYSLSDYLQLNRKPQLSKPVITASMDPIVCDGDSVNLHSSAVMGNMWSTGEGTRDIVVTQNGDYSLVYVNTDGCTVSSDTLSIKFEPTPSKPVINRTGHLLYTDSTAFSYQWYGPSGKITGATKPAYTATTEGNYYVIAFSNKGCDSDPSAIYPVSFVGIGELSLNKQLSIYPNPGTGLFNVESPENGMLLEVFDDLGRVIIRKENIGIGTQSLHIESKGSFHVRLSGSRGVLNSRVVVY